MMDEATIRRLVVTAAGIGAVAGLELNVEQITGVVTLVAMYLGQSAVVQKARIAGKTEAAKVVTTADAAALLGGEVQK